MSVRVHQVWKCRHRETGQVCAVKAVNLKMAKGDPKKKAWLMQEAQLQALCQHDKVVKVFEVFRWGNILYIIEELLGGGSLMDLACPRGIWGHLPEDRVAFIASQVVPCILLNTCPPPCKHCSFHQS